MTMMDDFERRLRTGLSDLAPAPADDLGTRVMAIVDATEQAMPRRWGRGGWQRPGLLLAAAALAGAVVGAVAVGSGLLRIPDVTPTPAPPPAESEAARPTGSPASSPADIPDVAHTIAVGSLTEARAWHGSTLLADGRILIAGGMGMTEDNVDSLEVWDPDTEEWAAFGSLPEPMPGVGGLARQGIELLLLPSGSVFVMPGGVFSSPPVADAATIVDPVAETIRSVPDLLLGRDGASATLLEDGRILIAGGTPDAVTGSTASAEVWDPAAETITTVGSMDADRAEHSATLLSDGRLLIVGGGRSLPGPGGLEPINTSEIWDPETGAFSPVPSLDGFNGHAVSLSDGTVLLLPRTERLDLGTDPVAASIWDPASATLTPAGSLATPRVGFTATLLPDGSVLIVGGLEYVGGEAYTGDPVRQVERWDPTSEAVVDAGTLLEPRYLHSATALRDGTVLIVGGLDQSTDGVSLLASAEQWIPESR